MCTLQYVVYVFEFVRPSVSATHTLQVFVCFSSISEECVCTSVVLVLEAMRPATNTLWLDLHNSTHTHTRKTQQGGETAALDSLRVLMSTATSKSTSVCG